MTGAELYGWLMAGTVRGLCEQFDAHVVGCAFGVVYDEALQSGSLCEGLGLSTAEIGELANAFFPHAALLWEALPPAPQPSFADDESCLQELLARCSSERSRFEALLARVIARRCQRPHHLWQDLGLRNRRELSWLMSRHFEPIASRNHSDMKWKKFLYRTICRDEGFGLCTAPTCSECSDYDGCFGDESGEGLLSQTRQSLPTHPLPERKPGDSAAPTAGTPLARER